MQQACAVHTALTQGALGAGAQVPSGDIGAAVRHQHVAAVPAACRV